MRILQLISSGGLYGIENMLLSLATELQAKGEDVTVGVFHNAQKPNLDIAESLQEKGIRIEIIPCSGRFDRKAVRTIREIIQKHSIDVVHSHGFKADLFALAATRPLKTPLLATCHNWPGTSMPLKFYAALDRWALRHFRRVVIISEHVANRLRRAGVDSERIVNIPNGVNTRLFSDGATASGIRAGQPGEVVVGFVGRLVREKGVDVLLRAAAEVVAVFSSARFVFVGEGPERSSLEALVQELGLTHNIFFAGRREDMPQVYAAFDICVLPSFAEAMPMTILEAMASGNAVIATNVGEIPRMIQSEETGILIQPGHVEELRNALLRLLHDQKLRQTMGQNGKARVRELFSLERMTQAYVEIYKEIVGGHLHHKEIVDTSDPHLSLPVEKPNDLVPQIVDNGNKDRRYTFSVIIPCLNEQAVIGRCLKSLNELDFDKSDFEVILGDNGSSDDTLQIARTTAGTLNLVIVNQAEGRVTGLRNLAANSARGEFLAFLDADCLVPKNWLRFATDQLSKPATGLIGGHCGLPENSPWVPQVWYSERQSHKRGAVSYLPGANLLVSRTNFLKIGKFDESLETNEDCELCERARQKGLTVFAYPELGVIHLRDPQTLLAFYRKQAWHGKHVFKVFLRNLPSLVNIKPVCFALVTLLAFFGVFFSLATRHWVYAGVWCILLLLPSFFLSLRIALRRRRWQDFFPLIALHLVYGAGRASALLNPMNWWGKSKTSERVKAGRIVPPSDHTKQPSELGSL